MVIDRAGATATDYLNGPGIDNKLRQTGGGWGTLYYLQDRLGSTLGLTGTGGGLVEAAQQYEGFGASAGSARTRYGYTGRERDDLTGLMYHRTRWYDTQQGRFLSEDLFGFLGGFNKYSYVINNPLKYRDPLGLKGDEPYLPNPDRKPPGWNPSWPTGVDKRGGYSEDPTSGRRYYPHKEDADVHWDHYDYKDKQGNDARYPQDCFKLPKKQTKRPEPGRQSKEDPWNNIEPSESTAERAMNWAAEHPFATGAIIFAVGAVIIIAVGATGGLGAVPILLL